MTLLKKVLVNAIPVAVIVLFFQNCSPNTQPDAQHIAKKPAVEKIKWVEL